MMAKTYKFEIGEKDIGVIIDFVVVFCIGLLICQSILIQDVIKIIVSTWAFMTYICLKMYKEMIYLKKRK